jgi:hypothetical protein
MADDRHNGPAAAARRIRLVAGHSLGAAAHRRLTQLLGVVGVAFVAGALGLRDFNFGTAELKFLGDFGLGAIGLLGTLLAVLAPSHLFFGDVASRSVTCILARPTRRWEYLAGVFAGTAALLAGFVALLALVLAAIIALRENALRASLVPLPVFLQACALVWLKLTLVAAMTLLVCSYAGSALFTNCAALLFALAAHLRSFAPGHGVLSWLRAWPDLGLFDPDALLGGGFAPPATWLAGLVAYWAVYLALFLGVGSYAFKHREF